MHGSRIGTIIGVGATLLAAGCGSSSSAPSATLGPPATFNVQVDNKTDPAINGEFTAYFPNDVKAHPGDTVIFTSVFRGEPHTVTLGSLVSGGLDDYDQKVKAAGGNPDAVDDSSIPLLARVPPLLPQGPGDANQSMVQPCFLDSGDPPGPGATPCPKREQPEFKGTETVFNSGFLPDAKTFAVKLSSSIKPGSYRYMCALHRTGMTGQIEVVAADKAASHPDDLRKQADEQLQKGASALQAPVDKANKGDAAHLSAGVVSFEEREAEANIFGPKQVSIPTGGSVTWTVIGAHTISFNASEDARPILLQSPDGGWHINQKGVKPVGGHGGVPLPRGGGPPASPGGPPASPGGPAGSPGGAQGSPGGAPQLPPPTLVDLGSWNGSGTWSSGLILSFPPQFDAVKLTFKHSGTYEYKCLIHPDMEGTVKVG